MIPIEPVIWQEASLSTLSQGLAHSQSHLESTCISERPDLVGPPLLPGTNSSQGTKVTLSFHILTDPLPPSPGFFRSLIYSTFFAFFFHHCPSSLKVCYFLGIFPLGDWCHIVLMLVTVSESGYFPTLFPNHENLWYSSSPLSMGDMFQDPQGILKSWW